ncbi:hypothetical protein ABVT39_007869 [Epinephelus coioides]
MPRRYGLKPRLLPLRSVYDVQTALVNCTQQQGDKPFLSIAVCFHKYLHCSLLPTRMNVGVAHSEVNPNTRVMNSRGIWLTYALGVGILHIVLLSIPFFSVPVVWTLTNVIHNFGMYVFMHAVKGTPFETPDQGKARLLTHWEQLDYGVQFTSSRKFFTISPIILYVLDIM